MQPSMALSGFWLENGCFITSAHWFKDTLQEKERQFAIKQMSDPERSIVKVSCRISSERPGDMDCSVWLWKHDPASDIAIFRVKPASIELLPPNPVKLDQLSVPPQDDSSFPVWTIAYSCHDTPLRVQEGKDFIEERKKEEPSDSEWYGQGSLEERENKGPRRWEKILQKNPSTVFEYLAYGYFESLDMTNQGKEIIGVLKYSKTPGVSQTIAAIDFLYVLI